MRKPMTFDAACAVYTDIVHTLYISEVARRGYGYTGTPMAPESLDDIAQAVDTCQTYHVPFPVYDGACCSTVLDSAMVNMMFRYLHDHEHVITGLGTSLADELELAEIWAMRVRAASGTYPREAIDAAVTIARIDTAGQSFYYAQHGKFPDNQREFARKIWGSV